MTYHGAFQKCYNTYSRPFNLARNCYFIKKIAGRPALVDPLRSTSGSLGPHRWLYDVSHNSIFQKIEFRDPFRKCARDLKTLHLSEENNSIHFSI